MSIITEEIDTEFEELFAQVFNETTLDKYIDFDSETITSHPAVDPTDVDWRQEWLEKSIRSCNKTSEALDILDAVKCLAEMHGDT